ncbi:MAG: hypothetical protein JNL80_04205 [Phycisphaerae bacterium]|jgi:hypothetical protein|nr:hypothetical protein [Phycisphaerae bacterium]
MSQTHRIAMLAIAASCCSCALGQHPGDINPTLHPGGGGFAKILTGVINAEGEQESDVRVFECAFGDSGFPEFTSNPGFDAVPGTFQAGTRVGFHVPDGFYRWDGTSPSLVTDERLDISYFTLAVTVGPAPNEGFDLAVQSNGGWHRHLSFSIGNESGGNAPPGIYVLPLVLYSTDRMVVASEPFWLVFNYLSNQTEQDAATAWVHEHWVSPFCIADTDFDGSVGAPDIANLLGAWGPAAATGFGDFNGDGLVGASDLAVLLGAWGSCP